MTFHTECWVYLTIELMSGNVIAPVGEYPVRRGFELFARLDLFFVSMAVLAERFPVAGITYLLFL